MRAGFVLLAVIVVSIATFAAAQTTKVDVSGVWVFSVESAAGTSSPTVTFKQEGEKITGHYSSGVVGEAPLVGTVKDQTIDFSNGTPSSIYSTTWTSHIDQPATAARMLLAVEAGLRTDACTLKLADVYDRVEFPESDKS